MYKSDHELEQGWVRTPRTHPLDTRHGRVFEVDGSMALLPVIQDGGRPASCSVCLA